ncbi:hypothetical protein EHF44_04290 [Cupriavidus pauculus]|uniref:Uncharacterized protein n=1 Tax=Cupriavidus pauculus TaxID=82633 RepID=A0A3G8GXK9_9BURK|nr:hypothetical protein EHF44_04290 [Cupriavidus pauculus]
MPSPPAPLPRCGRGEKPGSQASVFAGFSLPSPACGRGVGGEGRRVEMPRRLFAPPGPLPRPLSRDAGEGRNPEPGQRFRWVFALCWSNFLRHVDRWTITIDEERTT